MNTETQETAKVLNLPIEDIIPNRFQPRLSFDEQGLKELANSIKEHGIIQPLVVRKLAEKYEIIAGERRYKAAKLAGLTKVPAIITTMDDQKSAEAAIVENVQRRDLSAIEEAKSYQVLLEKENLTQEQLAKKMGLSQSAISNKLRLLTLPEAVQNALIEEKISERHARSLLQLEDKYEQEEWLNKIIDERLTVRELDRQIKRKITNDAKSTDIPLVESAPSIETIKEKATDIVGTYTNNLNTSAFASTEPQKKMPNKFFNFLEDESVSMNTNETSEDNENNFINIPIINYENDKKEKIEESVEENHSPENNDQQESSKEDDEIELLDFLAPGDNDLAPSSVIESISDEEKQINELVNKLKEKTNVKLSKEETDDNIMFIISIEKK